MLDTALCLRKPNAVIRGGLPQELLPGNKLEEDKKSMRNSEVMIDQETEMKSCTAEL